MKTSNIPFRKWTLALGFVGMLLFGAAGCETYSRMEQMELLGLNKPSEPSDMTVRQLIDAMHKASDPNDAFQNTKKYLLRQSLVSEQEIEKRKISREYVSEVRFAQPDRIRQTSFQNGAPFVISICRDGNAWSIDPESKKATKVPEGMGLDLFRTFTDMLNPQKTYLDIFKSVEIDCVYEGRTRLYRLVCQAFNEEIAPYVIYVDSETFLPAKMETILYQDDGKQTLYTSIPTDYQWIQQVRMPRTTFIKSNGRKDVCTITDFALDANIPDSDFELPKRARIDF